jgi:hypothetical protein
MFLCGLNVAQSVARSYKDENLIMDLPLPNGDWVQRQEKEKGILNIIWKKNRSNDFAMTIIWYWEFMPSNTYYKDGSDNTSKDDCDIYSSTVISEQSSNGYQSMTWESICQQDDEDYTKILFKLIIGNDSSYLLKRLWSKEPKKYDWNVWLDYFKSVIVCDSRGDQHPCPAD